MSKAKQLRGLLEGPGALVVPGVYDCIGAMLAERAGFECVFTSGFGISASLLGKPDFGLLTATEVLTAVGNMTRAVGVPLVADIDTGYGGPANVQRTVERLAELDVAGFILEDQEWPKRCGHFEGKSVIAPEEHAMKLRAAREVSGDMVMIARTDARAPLGLAEAISRGALYLDAGADVLFIEAPESLDEMEQISREFPGVPLFANMVEGGKTPLTDVGRLSGLGFRFVVFPVSGLLAATGAMEGIFAHIRENGTTAGSVPGFQFEAFKGFIGLPGLAALAKKYSPEP